MPYQQVETQYNQNVSGLGYTGQQQQQYQTSAHSTVMNVPVQQSQSQNQYDLGYNQPSFGQHNESP